MGNPAWLLSDWLKLHQKKLFYETTCHGWWNSELVGKCLIWPSKQIVFFVDWESKMAATEGQSCDIVPYGGNI